VAGLLGECRLVTVTGPGGVGKTRLAGEVAGLVAGRFADGAWLAELAAVRDPAQVAAVVAAALGIREQPGVAAAGALARVLAGQQLLLVLDNCEHVIESPRVLWRLPIHGRVGRWEQHGSIRTSCVTGRSGWCWTWSRIRRPA
jgi:predicted ATPase